MSYPPISPAGKTRHTRTWASFAGSLAALHAAAGSATIIHVNDRPVSLSMSASDGSSTLWDVDGAGGADFVLSKFNTLASSSILLGSFQHNGRGLIAHSTATQTAVNNVQALPRGFRVGVALSQFAWGAGYSSGTSNRRLMVNHDNGQSGGPSFWIGDEFKDGFHSGGEQWFGFRFLNDLGEMLYGYADIDFDTLSGIVTIGNWTYNDTPQAALSVPEPSSLALLALGYGGLSLWRRRRAAV